MKRGSIDQTGLVEEEGEGKDAALLLSRSTFSETPRRQCRSLYKAVIPFC